MRKKEYKELVRNINELDFITLCGTDRLSSNYRVNGTHYIINVVKNNLGLGQVHFWSKNGAHVHRVDFESVFDDLPEVIKMKFIFHLNLFGV